jgi:hypothetical protein
MTDAPQQPQTQPRGAGSGEKANATRDRNIVDWPPEPKAHSERVEELEAERDAQADYNSEMADMQMKQAADLKEKLGFPQGDPATAEEQREAAKETFENSTDPAKKKAALKGEMDARAKRDRAQVAAAQGQGPK